MVDYRPVLRSFSAIGFSLEPFILRLIDAYNIKTDDILIGHSLGGYLAYNISQIIDSETCLIGSFTDPDKIIRLVDNKYANYLMMLLGMPKWRIAKWRLLKNVPEGQAKRELAKVLDNFGTFRNWDLLKLVCLTYSKPIDGKRAPSLRIHALADRIVRPPAEAFRQAPGDHFCLLVHHWTVSQTIKGWLLSLKNQE